MKVLVPYTKGENLQKFQTYPIPVVETYNVLYHSNLEIHTAKQLHDLFLELLKLEIYEAKALLLGR
jgi:hypothetical protein